MPAEVSVGIQGEPAAQFDGSSPGHFKPGKADLSDLHPLAPLRPQQFSKCSSRSWVEDRGSQEKLKQILSSIVLCTSYDFEVDKTCGQIASIYITVGVLENGVVMLIFDETQSTPRCVLARDGYSNYRVNACGLCGMDISSVFSSLLCKSGL